MMKALIFTFLFLSLHFTSHALRIVLLGPPGAGKGTISKLIERDFGFKPISTGTIIRDHRHRRTYIWELYHLARKYGEREDKKVILTGLIFRRLMRPDFSRGVITDAWPKNFQDVGFFVKSFSNLGPVVVLHLDVPDEILQERIKTRRVCFNLKCGASYGAKVRPKHPKTCDYCGGPLATRRGDVPYKYLKRLGEYREVQEEILQNYRDHNVPIYYIDATPEPEVVLKQIKLHLKELVRTSHTPHS